MKKFTIIKENISTKLNIDPEMEEIQKDLMGIIDNSTNTDDNDLKLETMRSYIEDMETTIIGLINDSDIFDFYIKHRNQIDVTLTNIDHFDKSPSDLGVGSSVYDYIIKSTKISIQENFKNMINEQ